MKDHYDFLVVYIAKYEPVGDVKAGLDLWKAVLLALIWNTSRFPRNFIKL